MNGYAELVAELLPRYRVVYCETRTVGAQLHAIAEATTQKTADLVLFAGHGAFDRVQLGPTETPAITAARQRQGDDLYAAARSMGSRSSEATRARLRADDIAVQNALDAAARSPASGDLTLADQSLLATVRSRLSNGVRVILCSCSTGHGEARSNNIANMIARAWPQAIVHAPTIEGEADRFVFDQRGRVSQVSYSFSRRSGVEYVTSVKYGVPR